MRNSLINPLLQHEEASGGDDDLIAPGGALRLCLVGMVFVGCSLVILLRIAWVQTHLPERYLAALEATTTEVEVLPARDGRILADSLVLAADVEQYAVQVHYRWLQEPVDRLWMQQQVRLRLSRDERRRPELVSAADAAIHRERRMLRDNLTLYLALAPEDFEKQRQQIQTKVERIADSVNRRRMDRLSGEFADPERGADVEPPGWLMQAASAVRHSLTTAPSRMADDRIVVREEESWHTIVSSLPLATVATIHEHPELFPGARVSLSTQRIYPQRQLAAHVVGARTALQEQEREFRSPAATQGSDHTSMSRRGRFGVEMTYDDLLQGQAGLREIVRNRRQQIVSSTVTRVPRSGHDLVLTIDVELQQLCEQLLAECLTDAPRQLLLRSSSNGGVEGDPEVEEADTIGPAQPVPVGGSVLVMEAATGRLLAAASAPAFDLSLFAGGSVEDWKAANQDARRPFLSRFSGMALPPGSTFKTVTALAGLQTETLQPDTSIFCRGFLTSPQEHRCLIFRQFGRGHSEVNLKSALAMSCNVYFFQAAQQMGILPLTDWARRLQFGARTGVDLPFEKSGTVPGPPVSDSRDPDGSSALTSGSSSAGSSAASRRYEREALGFSIGQSRLTVTPLQMIRMMAAVANGGWLVTPHVVSDEGRSHHAADDTDDRGGFPRLPIPGLDSENLAAIRQALTAAVEDPMGTGYRTVRLPGIRMAGKTGTAESVPGKPDHAWFTGFAPADDPQYVFVVVLEHGGSGSHAAGPVAREIVRHLFQQPPQLRSARELSAR